MKRINEVFEDEEFERLQKRKGKRTWHDFIMTLLDEHGRKPRLNIRSRAVRKEHALHPQIQADMEAGRLGGEAK